MMEIDKAFKILGIPKDSNDDEIKKSFRKKSKKHHPDKAEGDEEKQTRLNNAYEIALAYTKIKKSLITTSSDELTSIIKRIQKNSINVEESTNRAKRKTTKSFQRLKYISWTTGGIAAFFALFSDNLIPTLELFYTNGELNQTVVNALEFATLSLGLIGLFFQLMVSRINNKIDSFTDSINNRKTCAKKMAEALNYKKTKEFAIQDIRINRMNYNINIRNEFPKNFFASIEQEIKPILIAKSLEHGLIDRIPEEEFTLESNEKFQLNFSPNLFEPKDKAQNQHQQEIELTRGEAIFQTTFGITLFLCTGGLTTYLIIVHSSYWAILSGFFSLGFLGMFWVGVEYWNKS